MTKAKSTTNHFPDQWDEKRVQMLINHYETQNEDDAVAEDKKYFDLAITHKATKPDSMWAVVKNGKIELINHDELPEGATLLVTLLPDSVPTPA